MNNNNTSNQPSDDEIKIKDIDLNCNKYLNAKKHIPPIVGEYAYYDARLVGKKPHWIIDNINNPELKGVGCHYSLDIMMGYQSYITCHGLIGTIHKKVRCLLHNYE
jgi:hypothetical protein